MTRHICTIFSFLGLVASWPLQAEPGVPAHSAADGLSFVHSAADPAAGRPATCFAPGTPQRYVEEVTSRVRFAPEPLLQTGEAVNEFRLGGRWSVTATDGGGLTQGDPTVLTWSYIPDGTNIPGFIGEPAAPSNLNAFLDGIYGDFDTWHPLFVQIFDAWAAVSGFTYVYEPNDDGAAFGSTVGQLGVRGDLRIGAHLIDGNSGVLAYNFFPNNGDMVIDSADSFYNNLSNNSLGLRNVLTHEHGHGLGLAHVCPVEQTKLMEPFVSFAFDGTQFDDILGVQRGYGDPLEHNDSSGTASVFAETIDSVSIDGTSDIDFYSFSGTGGIDIDITMTPLGFTYLEGPQNANGTCSAGTSFDALRLNDLEIALLDTDGSTVLATASSAAAGDPESITGFTVPASGTYFVRVMGSVDQVQRYQLEIEGLLDDLIFFGDFETGDASQWSSIGL